MQYVKIKFVNPEDEAKVFLDLARAGRSIVLKEGDSTVYVIPIKSLKILKKASIPYKELQRWD